jgi:Acyl-CoA dehydrogenase, C-terminal domain/Acetyl-CoA dehydrogenase C-terminal like
VLTEAQRVVVYRAALALDEAAHHGDAAVRARQGRAAALLTPVVKAWCTAQGFASASAALQVFGGYGYVHDHGIEQTLRDARIAMIYEGTNEIQAIDLLQRKVLGDGGTALGELLDELEAEAAACAQAGGLADFAQSLQAQTAAAREATQALLARGAGDAEWPLRVADDYLAGLSHTLLAWALAASARAALQTADRGFAAAKTTRMHYGRQWLLPQAAVHWARVRDPSLALPA